MATWLTAVCAVWQVPIYTEVKRAAETSLGIMTQCVARDNARKKNFMTLVRMA